MAANQVMFSQQSEKGSKIFFSIELGLIVAHRNFIYFILHMMVVSFAFLHNSL
jgi:hypothetical protein